MHAVSADARCFACDYLFARSNRARRPECGRPFDPDNLATVNMTGHDMGWWRLLLRPPGILLTLTATLPALLVPIWYARDPAVLFDSPLSLLLFSVPAVAAWLIRAIARAIVLVRFHYPRDLARPRNWRWFITPGILLMAWIIPLQSITRFSFRYSLAPVWRTTPGRSC